MTVFECIRLVSGSRYGDVPEGLVYEQLDTALAKAGRDQLLVIHGGQRGVDTIAHSWCIRRGVRVVSIPVLFEARGVEDGKERNRFLVSAGLIFAAHYKTEDLLLEAFPGPKSRGTRHCIDHARYFNIKTTVTTPDGTRVTYDFRSAQ